VETDEQQSADDDYFQCAHRFTLKYPFLNKAMFIIAACKHEMHFALDILFLAIA
jgi:hypothetical protein